MNNYKKLERTIIFVIIVFIFSSINFVSAQQPNRPPSPTPPSSVPPLLRPSPGPRIADCYDSDGGINPYTAGVVVTPPGGAENSYRDHCEEDTLGGMFWREYLVEYFCNPNPTSWKDAVASTRGECPQNYRCQDGRCLAMFDFPACLDSDGGQNFYVPGVVTLQAPDGLQTREPLVDYCNGRDDDDKELPANQLTEFFCGSDGQAYYRRVKCDSCSKGACVSPLAFCHDTDGGKVYDRQGTVTTYSYRPPAPAMLRRGTYTDKCEDNKLTEYFCSGFNPEMEEHDCGESSECQNGACIPVTPSPTPSQASPPKPWWRNFWQGFWQKMLGGGASLLNNVLKLFGR